MAVELSNGSYGHLAMPKPMPGTYSDLDMWVKLDCNKIVKHCIKNAGVRRLKELSFTGNEKKEHRNKNNVICRFICLTGVDACIETF